MGLDVLVDWAVTHPWPSVPLAAAAGLAGLPVVRAVLRAVADGRELSVGPVRIGAGVPVPVPTPAGGVPAPEPVADRSFSALEAERFYGLVAPSYDIRNTGPLLRTQLVTLNRIRRARVGRRTLEVLDLGGGTGREIATHFADDPTVTWTYVDFCPAMAAQFRSNLVEGPVRMTVRVLEEDLRRAHERLPAESFDVVLLSLVLSSMPQLPDLAPIARLLRPGGVLIVSDIDPLYTERNPFYSVRVDGDGEVSLRTTPVQPHQVAARALAAGLAHVDTETTSRGGDSYAFVAVFQAEHRRRIPGRR